MLGKKIFVTAAAGMLIAASGTASAAANFDADVASSIDKGLAWFDAAGCYSGSFSCGEATGLALLALLEKRPSADAAPAGYSGATADDQARMRRTVRHIIDSINSQGTGFYSYRDGAYMMALSVYMNSGGPDKDDGPGTELDGAPLTLKQALDKAFDRTIANQRKGLTDSAAPWPANNGYWCYTNSGCRDSSTTQLVIAGLAAARGAYLSGSYADAARVAQLNSATTLARDAYRRNGTPGGGCTATTPANEKGHGYNAGSTNSIQQTASGLWIQLVGGSALNWADTQAYMRWLQNRYRYTDIGGGVSDGWSGRSYWYYLWSSYKAYQFLLDSKAVPAAGNIGVSNIGTLPPADAPACAARQVNRDPATLPRVALFGDDGAGYYSAETKRVYFDYAYTIMSYQCADGNYYCNGAPSYWDQYAHNAYALLVLQRSVGGGCLDSDNDKICDANDPSVPEPPVVPPAGGGIYCDKNGNGTVDKSDITALMDLLRGAQGGVPVTSSNAWANSYRAGRSNAWANSYRAGRSALAIDMGDYEVCWMVYGKKRPPENR